MSFPENITSINYILGFYLILNLEDFFDIKSKFYSLLGRYSIAILIIKLL
jgi:hypothetical protein